MRHMIKLKYIILFVPLLFVFTSQAQQNPSFQVYKTFHAATDLMDKGKYVAAAEQFRSIEKSRFKTTTQPQFESELSLLKENAQYYEALCALELGNDDAESMFGRFINR
jgi:outer membrane protein assembly factor BamD (BamD/ComL family)